MAMGYGVACPKPTPRKRVKAKQKREDFKALRAFRDAVWAREIGRLNAIGGEWARCQRCRDYLLRGGVLRVGEVHHVIPRSRSKAERYNPANGQLLCQPCHRLVQAHRDEN